MTSSWWCRTTPTKMARGRSSPPDRADPRLRVLRQDTVLDVTQNWNATLAASRGDYVLMIGDYPTCFFPGFFGSDENRAGGPAPPDALTFEAWFYVSPGTAPGGEAGLYGAPCTKACELAAGGAFQSASRRKIPEELFAFRQPIALTMQTTLLSRRFIDALDGPVFAPPFPDWHAYAALCVRADDWRYLPHRCVVVGTSRGSFSQAFNQGGLPGGPGVPRVSVHRPGPRCRDARSGRRVAFDGSAHVR